MSSQAYVVRPAACCLVGRDGQLVSLLGFLPHQFAPQEKVDTFVEGRSTFPSKIDREEGWLVFERPVRAYTQNGLLTEARKLASDIQAHFGPIEVSVH